MGFAVSAVGARRARPRRSTHSPLDRAGDVAKLTDYVEQREIDSDRATQAVASIMEGGQTAAEREAEAARERELAAVAVDAADVALVAEQMDLEPAAAERKLREHRGDVVECLNALVSE